MTQIELGHAMVTMVEPHRDTLREYNTWYEHDHCYSGVMCGPGAFSFRRFVATKALKALRYPADGPIADPVTLGSFIALYWIERDKIDDLFAWSYAEMPALIEQGRMHPGRDHVSTACYDRLGGSAPSVPIEIALDHPYTGLVCTWTDVADGVATADLSAWFAAECFPAVVGAGSGRGGTGGPVGQVVELVVRDFPGTPSGVPSAPGVGTRLLHTWMLTVEPDACWASHFAGLGASITSSGLGRLALAAPFVPTVPGTDRYLDQLW